MRVLIVGSGGREHALAWACARHPSAPEIICAPGNAGTAEIAENLAVSVTEAGVIARIAAERGVDLVIVGPDAALAAGVTDACRARGIDVFGPSAAAARIETSKRFGKELMQIAKVPTARWRAGGRDARADLFDFVLELDGRCVVKADGLALGKGVAVCHDRDDATAALAACLNERRFGEAGDVVVVEELLEGEELSVFGISDGTRVEVLASARDYKRALDGDLGPNTGGMGAYAPGTPDSAFLEDIRRTTLEPVVRALGDAGTPFIGCLYAGLMLTSRGPRVLEYNARFGDPETQAVMPLVGENILDSFRAAAQGRLLDGFELQPDRAAVAVVACAAGYPAPPRVGDVITGLEARGSDALCFHAGTQRNNAGELVTAGGRVLSIVGLGANVAAAREHAYANLERVHFAGMRVRSDVGLTVTEVHS